MFHAISCTMNGHMSRLSVCHCCILCLLFSTQSWNKEAEANAQRWANTCSMNHSLDSSREISSQFIIIKVILIITPLGHEWPRCHYTVHKTALGHGTFWCIYLPCLKKSWECGLVFRSLRSIKWFKTTASSAENQPWRLSWWNYTGFLLLQTCVFLFN